MNTDFTVDSILDIFENRGYTTDSPQDIDSLRFELENVINPRKKNDKEALVVSFFGGPGSCKSIFCAESFAKLKWRGVQCEMALEWVKEKVWDNHMDIFKNQVYIFGKQYHRMFRLRNNVDVILTDSPFLMGCVYDITRDKNLHDVIVGEYKKFNTYNIFLERNEIYDQKGRNQDESGARKLDGEIKELLFETETEFEIVKAAEENVPVVVNNILERINYGKK